MEYVKNQKGIKSLKMDESIWNEIINNDNKIIVGFGSNGRGKSTLKELFRNQNLNKNFEMINDPQENKIYDYFGTCNYLVYDEEFINSFVFSNDGLHKNQSKIIMNTAEIESKIKEKNNTNEIIGSIIDICNKILGNSVQIEKVLDIKITGNITDAKKRFATTFVQGNFPRTYNDIFTFDDINHKNWWYEGLIYHKKLLPNNCPWCLNNLDRFQDEIKEQVESIDAISDINNKLFTDKDNKKNGLKQIQEEFILNEKINKLIEETIILIDNSIENNNEEQIINNMRKLRTAYENDIVILNEIVSKVKHINNIFDLERTNLTNRINELTFFLNITEEFKTLSEKIDYFIDYNNSVAQSINKSNKELAEIIMESENEINGCLKKLGLQYEIEINKNEVIENGVDDKSSYVFLKSTSGTDISETIANTLSYGEKSTLSFAIFIQQIKNKSTNNSIIILDDPISSYDIFRRYTSIDILRTLKDVEYKKIIILTHESSFTISLINNMKNFITPLILNETNEGEITIESLNYQYEAEVNYYKNILMNNNNKYSISQRVLALRQLHDLFKFISGEKNNLPIYNYLCKLVHYRKDENESWDEIYKTDLNKLFDYFGLCYDRSIEAIKDETIVFKNIEDLYKNITTKDVYSIEVEDICSLRMISEYAVRSESKSNKRFKINCQTMWMIDDSNKVKELENYRALLNSITHIDDDEVAWPTLCLNDFKAFPKVVINQILNIIK